MKWHNKLIERPHLTGVVSRGAKPERIYGKGYGESKLLNGSACEGTVKPTCSEEKHQLNRRTEFKIIKF